MSYFFSIVIPTFNRPDLLKRAIESSLSQSFTNYEVIVINDGSTEGISDYSQLESDYKKHEYVRFVTKNNGGASSARNKGIELSLGEYICFLDDDDEYLPNHLETLYDLIRVSPVKVGLFRTVTYIVENGSEKKQQFLVSKNNTEDVQRAYANLLVPVSCAVSRQIVDVIKFDETIPISEDYDLWTRILLKYPLIEIEVYTTKYYVHNSSTSASDSELVQLKHIKAFKKIFSIPGVSDKLPRKMRLDLLYKRYSWLSGIRKQKRDIIGFIIAKINTIIYFMKLRIG